MQSCFTGQNLPLEEQNYYHGFLPREEADTFLTENGDFLVRQSIRGNESKLIISCFWNHPRHFIIGFDEDGWKLEGDPFPTVPGLIIHYLQHSIELTQETGAILRRPMKKAVWQLNNDDIIKETKLGQGQFGEVWKGHLKNHEDNSKRTVAIKISVGEISDEEKKKFIEEARTMRKLHHQNIVQFIGIAATKQPIMIVMELICGGTLKAYLEKHKNTISTRQRIKFCLDAAKGMEYLASNGCIHRDLSARNCLLDKENNLKISDFGMTRQVDYSPTKSSKIPIRWTAPECLFYGIISSQSDVWSFGILMWEIFSNGELPYTQMDNLQVVKMVKKGGRLAVPANAPLEIGRLMEQCWKEKANERLQFQAIRNDLQKIYENQT